MERSHLNPGQSSQGLSFPLSCGR